MTNPIRNLLTIGVTPILAISVWAGPVDTEMDQVLAQYLRIHSSLTTDSTDEIDRAAQSMVRLVSGIQTHDVEVQSLVGKVLEAATAIQGKELKQARAQFFELSKPLLSYVESFYSGEQKYFRFYCSMAKKGWVQAAKDPMNPYYGSSMLKCGELLP